MSPKTYVRAITILAAAVFLLPMAFSQARGGGIPAPAGGGTGTGTGTTGISGGTTPSITTNPQANPNSSQNVPVPLPISGRVMVDDGVPPTETVVIERVCGGVSRAEGYTDHKG
jgi:hypothetical protein